MRRLFFCTLVAWLLALEPHAEAQASLPPRWGDLSRLAERWPAEWSALVRDVPAEDFEKEVMKRVHGMLDDKVPKADEYRRAEIVLAATLRHHLSVRRPAPLAASPKQALQVELENHLAKVRGVYLQTLGDGPEAVRLAQQWLPATSSENELRKVVLSLWLAQAKAQVEKLDHAAARKSLERIDAHFVDAVEADEIRKALHEQARGLLKAKPGQTLVVAVRSLPEYLSPASAWTEVERQALGLVFDRLYEVEYDTALGKRYRPRLAAALPHGAAGVSIPLRRDVYFSNGERLTVADIRRTARLMKDPDAAGRSALWQDYLEAPTVEEEDRFQLNVGYQQGLFDPLAPLTFWVLPRSKELPRGDDAKFAKAPVGSGPFQYVGPKVEGDKKYALFQANPHDVRRGRIAEIRMVAWTDPRKDLARPLPHLILGAPTDQLPALKELGYVESKTQAPGRVYFLAVNHRKASLASVKVRQALAHALDREALLDRHFRGESSKGKHHTASNGLMPRESWASAPAVRVPEFKADQARSLAREVKMEFATLDWTLKYPAGEQRVQACCEEMARTIGALFREAGVKADVQAQGLPPAVLRKALEERDYDLLYLSEPGLDDPIRLALLFDRQESATRMGGSNYLGYDSDGKLYELLRAALQHRQFSEVERNLQEIHVYLYKTMPAIPLWQLEVHVLVQPTLQTRAPLDPRAVFDSVREWKIAP